ncbi:MAG: sulfite exporter TauE/SafE family protein [Nitrospinae bacterium]|nr:sulfite exporter TauE/SafE family protein [Nitrospinota bacterium]
MELITGFENYLQSSILMSLMAAFIGGVLTSFTPCVYPMIPITAGYVSSQNLGSRSKIDAFILSLFYVIGVAITYSSLGAFASLTGRFFGEISTNPYAYFIVANIIILFGLSMLDVFILPIPSFLTGGVSDSRHRGFTGAILIGIASGFVAAPCTAPVLGVILTYVAAKQNVLFGISLLFAFSFGLGILLVLVGTFSGILSSFPKSGMWMVKIKKALGLFMIGLGEYFLIKMGQLII